MPSLNTPEGVRQHLDASNITTFALVLLLVPLKFWCRHVSGAKVGWDDAFTLASLLLACGFFVGVMIGIRPFLGQHADTLEISTVIYFLKFTFAAQLIYVTALGFVKMAILAFYWRLFSVRGRLPIILAAGLVTAWTIAANLALIFTCNPVEAQWNLALAATSTCVSRRAVYLGLSIPNVVTDVILLILPIPYVWKLHAPVAQRIVLAGMFSLGCFVSVVSIVRLSILMGLDLTSPDITFNMTQVFIWSGVEINTGLICACLPSLRPAVRRLGLQRLVPGSGPSAPDTGPDGHLKPSASSRVQAQSKKRSPFGGISTLGGATRFEDEEDSFQMINKYNDSHGKTATSIEPTRSRSSTDTGNTDTHRLAPVANGINVQRKLYVSVEEAGERGGG